MIINKAYTFLPGNYLLAIDPLSQTKPFGITISFPKNMNITKLVGVAPEKGMFLLFKNIKALAKR
jgi:hypothetical protein